MKKVRENLDKILDWWLYWDTTCPFTDLWRDADTVHCRKYMWKWRFNGWIVCRIKGHGPFYPDMCNKHEHDICMSCDNRRDRIER